MNLNQWLVVCEVLAVAGYLLYLLARKDRSLATLSLASALGVTAALDFFDFQAVFAPQQLLLWRKYSLWAEALLPLSWLAFSLSFARKGGLENSPRWQKLLLAITLSFPVAVAAVPIDRLFISPDFGEELLLFLGEPGYFYYLGLMIYLILALINLEFTLRSSSRPDRWKIKYDIVGAGLALTIFIVYFSQSLLYRSIDMSLLPARSLLLIVAVGVMAFSRMRRGEIPNIRLSKDIAYRSVVIFVVGVYLVGLALLGEGLRYFGETSQRTFFVALATVCGGAIVVVLLSEKVKRKINVFLHKNFFQSKFDYRQQWLDFTQAIANQTNSAELYQGILGFFCNTFALQGAGIFLREGEEFRCVAFYEWRPATEHLRLPAATLDQMRDKEWIVDYGKDEGTGDLPAIYPDTRTTCLVPLCSDQQLEGFIVLGARINPGEELIYEDYDLMKVLARQATAAIVNLQLSEQISAARQMELMARVSTFVLHDLKNLVSNLALVVDNAENYLDEPEFQQDMLQTLRATTEKMKALIERLKNLREKNLLDRHPCNLRELVDHTVKSLGSAGVKVSGPNVYAEVDSEEIQKVVLNLILNGLDAGGHRQAVEVETGINDEPYIRVSDQGCGMSEEFIRNRLFRPFASTKTKGFGIGLYQCRQIVDAHNGRIEVSSREGEGTTFTVWLPKASEPGG